MGAFLDWAAVALPTFLAILGVFVSVETPRLQSSRERLFWRGGLIVFGLIVSIVTAWQQHNSRQDATEIKDLLGGIADSMKVDRNKSPASQAEEIKKRLEGMEAQVAAISNPPRALDILYQEGKSIARVVGIQLASDQKSVSFQGVTSDHEINFGKQIELQNVRLQCASKAGPTSVLTFGASQSFTYTDVACSLTANLPR